MRRTTWLVAVGAALAIVAGQAIAHKVGLSQPSVAERIEFCNRYHPWAPPPTPPQPAR